MVSDWRARWRDDRPPQPGDSVLPAICDSHGAAAPASDVVNGRSSCRQGDPAACRRPADGDLVRHRPCRRAAELAPRARSMKLICSRPCCRRQGRHGIGSVAASRRSLAARRTAAARREQVILIFPPDIAPRCYAFGAANWLRKSHDLVCLPSFQGGWVQAPLACYTRRPSASRLYLAAFPSSCRRVRARGAQMLPEGRGRPNLGVARLDPGCAPGPFLQAWQDAAGVAACWPTCDLAHREHLRWCCVPPFEVPPHPSGRQVRTLNSPIACGRARPVRRFGLRTPRSRLRARPRTRPSDYLPSTVPLHRGPSQLFDAFARSTPPTSRRRKGGLGFTASGFPSNRGFSRWAAARPATTRPRVLPRGGDPRRRAAAPSGAAAGRSRSRRHRP